MASISKERLREMEEEMDRFEAEIQVPGGPPRPGGGFILGAKTFDKVSAQLTTLRQEVTRKQQLQRHGHHQQDSDDDDDSDGGDDDESFRDVDMRPQVGEKRKFHRDEPDDNEFYDIDERPGRPQGPLIPPPPPPPQPPPGVRPQHRPNLQDGPFSTVLAPPPPPPPEPHSTLSFKPYSQGEGPAVARPAFMPPQLRHRAPPPPGYRPPFPRPPMRMGGPPMAGGFRPPPQQMMGAPSGGFAPPPPPPPPMMMGPGPQMGPPMSHPAGMPMPGPQMMPQQIAPGMDPGTMQFMAPAGEIEAQPVIDQPKVVYAAAPQITVTVEKKEKKKKKKKLKVEGGEQSKVDTSQIGPIVPSQTPGPLQTDEDKSIEAIILAAENMHGYHSTPGGDNALTGAAGAPLSKKEKKKKEKKFIRLAASTVWEDPTLQEWQQDDFRMFCGDLGNEVTDETLVRAFNKYPSFLKAKVVRDRRSNKTKGYGFVSFKDPVDFTRAMREMNGKYVGNRPIKLRKSQWKDRNIEVVKKKDKEKKKLGLK